MTKAHASAAGSRDTHVPAHDDVPAYTLRMSARATHVRLNVTPREGLVVVVPRGARGFDPTPILRSKREWIEESLAHFADLREAYSADPGELLPARIVFPATGERWRVEYRRTAADHVSARNGTRETVVVSGAVDDATACLAALNRWLQSRARERLIPLLAAHAETTGLHYRKAGVRGQRGRWGGCSTSGSITLNRCLLFLSPELVDSVVLHELAHLVHPNHSAAFWGELQRLDPLARDHRRAIRNAWSLVPIWAEPWVLRRP